MRFLLYANVTNPEAVALSQDLAQAITDSGSSFLFWHENDSLAQLSCDIIVVIGGDGTVLRAVRQLYSLRVPFWSVNCGHLGYLTDCEKVNALPLIDKILTHDYEIQKRMMLSGIMSVSADASGTHSFYALNEAVIHRSGFARTLKISLMIDGTEINSFSGDGILVSTPAGSTAYNLSAGGPLLMPTSDIIVITPICPHSAMCAPLVVPGSSDVTIKIFYSSAECDNDAFSLPQLVVDGCQHFYLSDGDSVTCSMSDCRADFVQTEKLGFYKRLQAKLQCHD